VEGWLPYAKVFTMLAAGRRHVMMGAAQIDRYGNQNISCIGDWKRPKAQLLGVRGAPVVATVFPLTIPDEVPVTRPPTAGGLELIRTRLDPGGAREKQLA